MYLQDIFDPESSFSSTCSTILTTSPSSELTSAHDTSISETPLKQTPTNIGALRSKELVKQVLLQHAKNLGELVIDGVYLDEELFWLLIKSKLRRVHLQTFTFDPNSLYYFEHAYQHLSGTNYSNYYFRLAVQFNDYAVKWILYKGFSPKETFCDEEADSLLFILPGNKPQESLLYNISSLVIIQPNSDLKSPLSSEHEEIIKSMVNHEHPKLKRLSLVNINSDKCIEDYIPLSRLKLDYIHIGNCIYKTNDPIWSAVDLSIKLFDSAHMEKAQCFQFAVPINGHTSHIVLNKCVPTLISNSSALLSGLVLSLGQNFPSDVLLDNISFLVFLPSKIYHSETLSSQSKHLPSEADSSETLSSQSKQSLKSIKNSLCPKLRYLLLKGVSLNDVEENLGSIGQLGLEISNL